MKYYLMRSCIDWSDECDFEGFVILTDIELQKYYDAIKQMQEELCEFSLNFGTNQYNEYDNINDFLHQESENIHITEITREEYMTLKTLKLREFGQCVYDGVVNYLQN